MTKRAAPPPPLAQTWMRGFMMKSNGRLVRATCGKTREEAVRLAQQLRVLPDNPTVVPVDLHVKERRS